MGEQAPILEGNDVFGVPYLANYRLKFSEIIGYTVPAVISIFVLSCACFLLRLP